MAFVSSNCTIMVSIRSFHAKYLQNYKSTLKYKYIHKVCNDTYVKFLLCRDCVQMFWPLIPLEVLCTSLITWRTRRISHYQSITRNQSRFKGFNRTTVWWSTYVFIYGTVFVSQQFGFSPIVCNFCWFPQLVLLIAERIVIIRDYYSSRRWQ